MLATSGSGGGMTLRPAARSGVRTPGRAGQTTEANDDTGTRTTGWATAEPDPAVRAAALEVVHRLRLPGPRKVARARRGSGRIHTVPFNGGASEIELDRTVERLVEGTLHGAEDVLVRERRDRRRAVALAVDLSGSMRGERMKTVAGTVAGLATELAGENLAVLAFWSDAALLLPMGGVVSPGRLVEALLRIPAEGLTNVSFPLELAAEQLRRTRVADPRVVLLSDCVHNAGPDPRLAAARLPRLDVLFDDSGECDRALASDLARVGRGRLARVSGYRDVPGALRRIFAG